MNNQIINFFVELWHRIGAKSPKFFKVLQVFAASLTLLGFLPTVMDRWFAIEVPDNFVNFCKDVSTHAIVFFAAASLPVNKPPVGQTVEGRAITVTDEKKMPYTASNEAPKAEPPVITEVPEKPINTDNDKT